MFFASKNYAVGVDIGTSSIKAVELVLKNGRAHLHNYGHVQLDNNTETLSGGLSFEAQKRSYLSALLNKMNLQDPGSMYVAIPGSNGLVSLIEFPEMSQSELASAIQFEAHKYVPADLNEVALSWDVVQGSFRSEKKGVFGIGGSQAPSSGTLEVLLVAAMKSDIEQVEGMFHGSQFGLKAIELETFSLSRALVGRDPGTHLVVDIGFKVCNFILIHDGLVRVNRSIDLGGNEITKTIADSMNISLDRAEQMKTSGKDFFQEESSSLVLPSINTTINETKRILSAFEKRLPQAQRQPKIILSGGGSQLSGMREFFMRTFGIEVVMGDSWRFVSYDKRLQPYIQNMKSSFAVSVGLALRGLEEAMK